MGAGRAIVLALVLIHVGLAVWALAGLAEFLIPDPPWPTVSNPRFPAWMLALQWVASLIGAGVLIIGAARRWPGTPRALAAAYGLMAAICATQHASGMIERPGHWRELATEYVTYAVILALMFFARSVRREFGIVES